MNRSGFFSLLSIFLLSAVLQASLPFSSRIINEELTSRDKNHALSSPSNIIFNQLADADNQTVTVLQKPEVLITRPEKDWHKTSQMEMAIEAKIKYVYSELDVVCTVNGIQVDFDFFYDRVSFTADLQKGTNVIKVLVSNEDGNTNDIKRVIFDPTFVVSKNDLSVDLLIGAPVVELISPADPLTKSETDVYSIHAYIEHVEKKEDISLTANGMELTGFRFDPILGSLTIRVRLAEGYNDFALSAKNSKGRTEKTFRIQYGAVEEEVKAEEAELEPPADVEYEEVIISDDETEETENEAAKSVPEIQLLHPDTNPYYARQEKVLIQAKITGINSSSDIDFLIDGKRNIFYNYNAATQILRYELQLISEESEVRIAARNEEGMNSVYLKIIFGENPVVNEGGTNEMILFEKVSPPEIYCLTHFEVRINIPANKEDLELELNGGQVGNFMYNKAESKMRFSLYLKNGSNNIAVTVNNNSGKFKSDLVMECYDYESEYEAEPEITEPAFIEYIIPETGTTTLEETVILQIKTGNIRSGEEIKVLLNDKEVNKLEFDPVNSLAQVMLTLSPKNNTIYVGAHNDLGGEETEVTIYYDKPFTKAPEISISSPKNGFNSDKDMVMFRANIDHIKDLSAARLFLNKKRIRDFDYNEDMGRIQTLIKLDLGRNNLEVRAENNIGETVETISLNYRVRAIPAVQIHQPRAGLEYKDKKVNLYATVQNINLKTGITVQVNGKPVPSFNFNKNREEVTANILLSEGENTIEVITKNDNGTATDKVQINVRGALKKPEIHLINPAKTEVTVSTGILEFEAEVREIIHSTQVDISVNGKILDDVFYLKDSKRVKAEIPLTKGKNVIKVVVSNDSGLDSKTLQVTYK